MRASENLPRQMRLTEPVAALVLAKGRVFRPRAAEPPGLTAKVVARPGEVIGEPKLRFALAVPKRLLKRAVDRNLVKRHLREAIRHSDLRSVPVDTIITLRAIEPPRTRVARDRFRGVAARFVAQLSASCK